MEVRGRGREAQRGPEYQPLPAVAGGRHPGTEGSAHPHSLQELQTYVFITGLPGQRQQNSHGGAGETIPVRFFTSRCIKDFADHDELHFLSLKGVGPGE